MARTDLIKITPEVLRAIPDWVERGATKADIADALGVTIGSLNVTCSKHGVSLARTGMPITTLQRKLGADRWQELARHAAARDVPVAVLVFSIVLAVVNGDLIGAVLDDGIDTNL